MTQLFDFLAVVIVGVLSSLVAPSVKSHLEQKREQRERKKKLIDDCRCYLEGNPSREVFSKCPIYASLRPYLSDYTIKTVEEERVVIASGKGRNCGVNPFMIKVLDELALLEKNWKLV